MSPGIVLKSVSNLKKVPFHNTKVAGARTKTSVSNLKKVPFHNAAGSMDPV